MTYRPNSAIQKQKKLVRKQAEPFFIWSHPKAGIAGSKVGTDVHRVSVGFDGDSTGGIVVMILAFCLLFRGTAFA